jgi:hypothetical protein
VNRNRKLIINVKFQSNFVVADTESAHRSCLPAGRNCESHWFEDNWRLVNSFSLPFFPLRVVGGMQCSLMFYFNSMLCLVDIPSLNEYNLNKNLLCIPGHYNAYVYSRVEKTWVLCDDRKTEKVDLSEALCDSASKCYLLVYEAVDEEGVGNDVVAQSDSDGNEENVDDEQMEISNSDSENEGA